jgi:hypothetical protein
MKRKYIILILILAVIGTWNSCKNSFLDVKPAGSLSADVLATQKGVDGLLTGCYHFLSGQSYLTPNWGASTTNWVYGSIRGMEANKGTWSGDQPDINPIMTYNEEATNDYINSQWLFLYDAINRCNQTIVVANQALTNQAITQEQADNFIQQATALRGWYHFMAVRMWGPKVPYLDETTDPTTVKNDVDISDAVIADLTVGTSLATNMGAVGRFNKTVCQVLLGKALMQLKHDYAGALVQFNAAKTGTKADGSPIGLATTYGEIFDIANRNGIEAIYTVQYSVNDNSGGANGGNGEVLNFPYGSGKPGTCCGFFQPTQEFVNSFRTSAGLPLLDNSYDVGANQVKNDYGLLPGDPFVPDAGPLDPRLDWAVGRRGINYWDWGPVTGSDWLRDPTYAGPYNPKKQVYKKSQEGTFTEVGNWTSGWTANGYRMIRYADLLLMIAECQIEGGDLASARTNINLVRARAANTDGFVKQDDGVTPAANYVIAEYPASGYPFDTQDNARLALRLERKLELGQEGHRYFDLQRWGNVVQELSRALTYEESMPWGTNCYVHATVTAKNVNYPIPQRQIDLSNGNLVQNAEHQ